MQEIKNKLTTEPIDEIFKRISEDTVTEQISEDLEPEKESEKKTHTKQMKLSKFFEKDENWNILTQINQLQR